ncbi:TSUP family transporter [Pelistega indica]|uniref:TSUP family transporter n=1 Tax=Pelistega indica TaxID=1414851 RepID=UPI001C45DAE2|nr:TSUP family transporter [Pelistega indica]
MWNDILLALANLLTSALTGITGLGGGMILIGIMPFFVPSIAIIPVHGVTQLASNATRAWFGREHIVYERFWSFLCGSIIGMIVFGVLIRFVKLDLIPLFIGIYILLLQWSPWFNRVIRHYESFFSGGLFTSRFRCICRHTGTLKYCGIK